MIEISISRELADAHPQFMADCADRGHAISVFDGARPTPRRAKLQPAMTPPDSGPADAPRTSKSP